MSPNNSFSIHRRNIWIKGLLIVTVLLLIATGCGKKNTKADEGTIVATYKGGQVTEKEFNGFLGADKFFNYSQMYALYESSPTFKKDMLNQYIGMQYLIKDASEDIVKKAEKSAKDQMDQFQKSMTDKQNKDQYTKMLKELGIEEPDLQLYMKRQLILADLLKQKFPDDQVKAQYDKDIKENKDKFTKATVDHILIALKDPNTNKDIRTKEEALKRAQEVEAKLKNGGDFAALAKEYSDDPGSKDSGGQYKDADVNSWVPEFKKAALELPLNTISDPIETQYGYHVMKVESRTEGKYEDVKDQVRSELIQQYLSDFMQKDLPGIVTSINLPEPSPSPSASPAASPSASPAAGK